MPSPAALLLSLLVPSVAAASGGSDFAAWAVGEPALEPHLLPRPHGGTGSSLLTRGHARHLSVLGTETQPIKSGSPLRSS